MENFSYAFGLNLVQISIVKIVADELKTFAKLDIAAKGFRKITDLPDSIAVIIKPLTTTGINLIINNGYA